MCLPTGAKLLAPAEGWWPSATNWRPFGPPFGSRVVCLFVCLLTCLFFILIFLQHPHEYTLKILLVRSSHGIKELAPFFIDLRAK